MIQELPLPVDAQPGLDGVFLHVFGRAVRIIAIADNVEESNAYCERTTAAVIAEYGPLILLADEGDLGTRL